MVQPDNEQLYNIVVECYRKRRSAEMEFLAGLGLMGENRPSECEKLYKLLCKLGKHVHVAKVLIQGAIWLSQDFGGEFKVDSLISPRMEKIPLTPSEGTVEKTIGRMFSTTQEQDLLMSRLRSIWDLSDLTRKLQTNKSNKKIYVHAELILLDYVERNNCQFLSGEDKYIGCSKPACYLCRAYIAFHPGRYAIPASHQKLYISWSPPGLSYQSSYRYLLEVSQQRILFDMIEFIRKDITTDIECRKKPFPYHADSTSGLTTISRDYGSSRVNAAIVNRLELDCRYSNIPH